jgi:predicted MPP superfamily phosphohydrolase
MRLLRGHERPRSLRTGWRRLSRRWNPRQPLEITQNPVVLRALPAAFDGLRVAQLSDIHHSLYRRRRYTAGWDRLHETQIYVCRELGKSIVPLRIGCPPEIALLELRRRPFDKFEEHSPRDAGRK